ncbi:ACC synthase [Lentithecium fluviatile CBS 122367]|uniref:ACC synthase n=1 Tax=Lentithecium fluviatile CBS 122367 TaxID=1168545 RepID=A0A6G1IFQ1_9PLEO|nr:ACC synthase [Lentithecium fluviatile CBS 122367]
MSVSRNYSLPLRMAEPALSKRGKQASIEGAAESAVWSVLSNLWHPDTNPNGFISLGVAENSLMHSELRDFINTKALVDSEARGLTYGDGPCGSIPLRSALSSFLNKYFDPATPVKPEQLMVTCGLSSAIEHCSWAVADAGEGILLGRPYYRAFLPDIGLRMGVEVVTVAFGDMDPCGPDCVGKYEEALIRSNEAGIKVKALMLCHPHNPLGRCYSRETIIGLMKLCQTYRIHLISDEIYALSVWENAVDELDTPPTPFESALSIDTTDIIDPSLVHVLWGFSKDFGANGIRLGMIVSQANPPLILAMQTCSLYSSPSSLTENAAVTILSDTKFLSSYIQKNQERLSSAYTFAVKILCKYGIEHMPGVNAAFFLWLNLGKKFLDNAEGKQLPTGVAIDEPQATKITQVIYDRLMEKKIFLVLGDAAGAEEAGWFRLVFTQAPELVEEGVRRIAEALES